MMKKLTDDLTMNAGETEMGQLFMCVVRALAYLFLKNRVGISRLNGDTNTLTNTNTYLILKNKIDITR